MSAVTSKSLEKNQRHFMYWTIEKEVSLIKYFEQHRYLWDTDHVLFHKRGLRVQSYAELVKLLGIEEGIIRQRWSSMRSQFCREQRKVERVPWYVPTWDHYSSLLFLRKRARTPHMRRELILKARHEESQKDESPLKEEYEKTSPPQIYEMGEAIDSSSSEENFSFPQNEDNFVQPLHDDPQNVAEQSCDNVADTVETASHGEDIPLDQREIVFVPTISNGSQTRRLKHERQTRRWNPGYEPRYHEEQRVMPSSSSTTPKTLSPSLAELGESAKENESFSHYIASVLNRFHPDKQRRCRNELLRIILKYDMNENEIN